jgi:hypothetical protein
MAFGKMKRGVVGVSDDIGTSPDVVQLTAFTSQDLMALSPAGVSLPRGLIVSNVGAGTKSLVVTTAAGNQRTLDVTNMQAAYMPLCIRTVDAASTVTAVLLFY